MCSYLLAVALGLLKLFLTLVQLALVLLQLVLGLGQLGLDLQDQRETTVSGTIDYRPLIGFPQWSRDLCSAPSEPDWAAVPGSAGSAVVPVGFGYPVIVPCSADFLSGPPPAPAGPSGPDGKMSTVEPGSLWASALLYLLNPAASPHLYHSVIHQSLQRLCALNLLLPKCKCGL